MFRYVVLGLLRSGTGLHGYALMKRYRQRTGLSINTGSFYRELQRLVSERLIANAARGADADPRRSPYVITEAGIVAFDEWFAAPIPAGSTSSGEDQLAARLLFLAEAPPEVANSVLGTWQEALWTRAKQLRHVREAALDDPHATQGFDVLPHLLGRRLRHIAADIELIEELRRAYGAWPATPASGAPAEDELPAPRSQLPLQHRSA